MKVMVVMTATLMVVMSEEDTPQTVVVTIVFLAVGFRQKNSCLYNNISLLQRCNFQVYFGVAILDCKK